MAYRPSLPLLVIAASTSLCGWASSQRTLEPGLQHGVNQAIDRGIDALLAQQELDGSWRAFQNTFPTGQTALSLYTLLKCGVPREHLAVRRAVEFLRYRPPKKTYSAAFQILAFTSLGDASDRENVQAIVDLMDQWEKTGGFGYPARIADLSNTQIAALGLRAADRAGHDVPQHIWKQMANTILQYQEQFSDDMEPAGFSYRKNRAATGSMTAGGVGILAMCAEKGVKNRRTERGMSLGLAWLGREFTVDANPHGGGGFLYYYLYGLERLGGLLGLERIGTHDWYAEGAEVLLKRQESDGMWEGQAETCFALLFLSKATAPVTGQPTPRARGRFATEDPDADVTLRASGDTPLTLWIGSFGPLVQAYEWEGEGGKGPRVVRVDYVLTSPGEERTFGTVQGDPRKPAEDERYAIQHAFPAAGTYRVFAAVHVLKPGEPEGEAILRSPELDVRVTQSGSEELLEYARDAQRNLLREAEVVATASSEAAEQLTAPKVADNLQATAWRSRIGDPEPWIRLELGKAQRGNIVLLSHPPAPERGEPDLGGRILRVALRVNDAKKPIEVELAPEAWRKTVVDLSKSMRITSLELRVLETTDGELGPGGAGLAEIELQKRKK